ncbi:MAG TPA: hypothetical protein VLA72_01265, partial [Anaerolineales bacterium]|nr:hypothetical protein [Anaerolineales bacterium]
LSIQVDTQPPNLIDEMKARIDSEQGKRIWGSWSRSLPTSACRSACIDLCCARNGKWMYNGLVRGSLWFTISARSTPLGHGSKPWRSEIPKTACNLRNGSLCGMPDREGSL